MKLVKIIVRVFTSKELARIKTTGELREIYRSKKNATFTFSKRKKKIHPSEVRICVCVSIFIRVLLVLVHGEHLYDTVPRLTSLPEYREKEEVLFYIHTFA